MSTLHCEGGLSEPSTPISSIKTVDPQDTMAITVRNLLGHETLVEVPGDATLVDLQRACNPHAQDTDETDETNEDKDKEGNANASKEGSTSGSSGELRRLARQVARKVFTCGGRVLVGGATTLREQHVVSGSTIVVQPKMQAGVDTRTTVANRVIDSRRESEAVLRDRLADGKPISVMVNIGGKMVPVQLSLKPQASTDTKPNTDSAANQASQANQGKEASASSTRPAWKQEAVEQAPVPLLPSSLADATLEQHLQLLLDAQRNAAKAEKLRERENRQVESKFDRLRDKIKQRKLRKSLGATKRKRAQEQALAEARAVVKSMREAEMLAQGKPRVCHTMRVGVASASVFMPPLTASVTSADPKAARGFAGMSKGFLL
eukprot:m.14531 g.14531  ORF g.14531 m.14531 type:complete len:377 (+) comp4831_c0_seq1:478-1608(+)